MYLPIAGFLQSFKLPRCGIISGKRWLVFGLLVATAFGQTVTADFDARSGKTYFIPSGMFGVNGAALSDPTTLKALSGAGLTETRKVASLVRGYGTRKPE